MDTRHWTPDRFSAVTGAVPAPGETYIPTYGPTSVTLTVYAVPIVTTQPVAVTVLSGQTATFTAAATGYPAPTVQWQHSTNGTTWVALAGATSPTYSTVTNAYLDNLSFRAVFTNSLGTATTYAVVLEVT